MDSKYEGAMARTLRAEQHQNTEDHHDICDDTNQRVRGTLTCKQFVGFSVAMFIAMFCWFESSNNEWLWASHAMNNAIFEDDPTFLTKNDGWAWNSFQETASTVRMNGFIQVVHDGEHPNLQKWYLQDQLRQLEPSPEDGVGNQFGSVIEQTFLTY